MLQFSDCEYTPFNYRDSLASWGFGNQASSWVNIKYLGRVTVESSPGNVLWVMAPNSLSAYVGSGHNDRANNFACQL
ncbi:hypothetical protein KEM60_03086 [Austwickia sp. TVS 96-490-7B]|nr:hypothetical protein [Austwickia sp. TVS 96-490-7B]